MTDKRTQEHASESNMEKDPKDWVTGDEPMTGAQRSYLKTLSEEAREPFDENLTKAEASRRIDELQARTGRGSHVGDAQPPTRNTSQETSRQSPGRDGEDPTDAGSRGESGGERSGPT